MRPRDARVFASRPPTKDDGTIPMIGVGITVHNREDITKSTVKKWRALLPKDAVLVIVDDASDVPYPDADFRFEQNVGIARAKNKCFELLEYHGVDEFFLADNDCYPISRNWWRPYIESPEPHLSYQFLDLVGPVKLHDMKVIYSDSKHVAYTGQRGCLLYYNKKCLERVGGFDPIYGRALYEHSDLANRIHAAGLTTWRYADVANSSKLWHSMDEHGQVKRTLSNAEMKKFIEPNVKLHNERRFSEYQGFVPYCEDRDASGEVLITTLLTANPDPQRGFKWEPDPKNISPWLETVERGGWDGVVLADELKKLPGYSSKVVNVEPSTMNIYYQRWLHIYQYLREHQEIKWVWCTDGSDVEVLRDPFEDMAPGKLYTGVESIQVDTQWWRANHKATVFQNFAKIHGKKPLLNAGVVGGERAVVQELARRIITIANDIEMNRFFGREEKTPEVGDMAAFNVAAYGHFGNRLVYGPHITTEFKAFTDNGTAKFKHK